MTNSDNKRIAKNTAFLYIRMFLIVVVNLYTIRIVFKTLGQEDYGINNVVGGIVTMFSFITSMMVSASQRFFAFELGRNNFQRLKQYFNLTQICYAGISLLVLLLAETVGLWFLDNYLQIPADRMDAAHWVYHFSILAFMIQLVAIPYNSIIIAREKMHIYAYVSIAEVVLKLCIVFMLVIFNADKLKVYVVLLCSVSFIISSFYVLYCRRKFKECRWSFFWNSKMFKEIMSFSGWSLFGALANVFRGQGINIILNMFFGPLINTARAIAYQVGGVIDMFVSNFFQAVRPQITKLYASNESSEMMTLVFRSSRFCYYLMLFFAIPLWIEMPYILNLWLDDVPAYTVLFARLVLLTSLIDAVGSPLMTAVNATGNIKWYQIVTGGWLILTLPISYIFLKCGYPPQITMYVALFISLLSQISRIVFMKKQLQMSVSTYFRDIILVIVVVTLLACIVPFLIYYTMKDSFMRLIILTVSSFIYSFLIIYLVGITSEERKIFHYFARSKMSVIFTHKNNKSKLS